MDYMNLFKEESFSIIFEKLFFKGHVQNDANKENMISWPNNRLEMGWSIPAECQQILHMKSHK
jgi:hypothetical protein